MRRPTLALLSLTLVACRAAPKQAQQDAKADASSPAKPAEREPDEVSPAEPRPQPAIVRTDLVAGDLPPVPQLDEAPTTELGAGEFAFPEGTDELALRGAASLREGLLLVGQGYLNRRPGTPPQSWRWAGFVPSAGGEARSSLYDPGAIRAVIAHEGGALVTGTRGLGFESRGWFAKVTPDGTITDETALDSPNSTEMFALIPGRGDELAVVGGYVDAQGWLVSLDARGDRRWEKYIGSYGYTQVRDLARLDAGDILAIGVRGREFGEGWSALVPGDGGKSAAGDDVEQTKIEIAGADKNQLLRAIVDLGESGYVALGTAKRNHLQAHDQLLAVGFDRSGKLTWSRVIAEARVTELVAARRDGNTAAVLVAAATSDDSEPKTALALVQVPGDPKAPIVARRLAASEGWTGVGFVDANSGIELIASEPTASGVKWRRLGVSE